MPRGRTKRVYPPELIERVRELYASGMTQDEVAAVLSTTRKIVYGLMRNHDIERRPQIKRDQRGEKNSSWRGDRATYAATHYRVYAQRGQPVGCEDCGTTDPTKSYEWASVTKNYADPMDYRRLCASCHKRFDHIALNLGAYAVRKELPAS